MANKKDYNPLTAAAPPEVPLANAPLVRVICQVRFPTILSIEKRELVGTFQEAIRGAYPVLRPGQARGLVLSPQSVEQVQSETIWRFSDTEGNWRASLAPGFVALEAVKYSSRSEFIRRLFVLLQAVNQYIGPKTVDRLGVRYIDRITGEPLSRIEKLVRQEMLGVLTTPAGNNALRLLSEALFDLPHEKGQMQVKWGSLPANTTIDPRAVEPEARPSWILDIDVFSTDTTTLFNPEGLANTASGYAERIYTFFRWMVTEDFLREYGGK